MFVDVGGILSETRPRTTERESRMVSEKPTFSPLSTGSVNSKAPSIARNTTGISCSEGNTNISVSILEKM